MPGTLTRWDPFAEISDLRAHLDRLFDERGAGRDRGWMPAIDVVRDNGTLVLRVDIPGIKPEEVKIEVADDVLTVTGQHEETKEEKDKNYVRRERRYGSFYRSMPLPSGVDPETIEAKTHDGVLDVRIPLPEEGKKKTVAITPTAE